MACKMLERFHHHVEVLPEKAKLAHETFQVAQMEGVIRLVEGDARQYLSPVPKYCLLLPGCREGSLRRVLLKR